MAKRRKKRTSIRTAAGTAQQSMSQRLEALRDDPLRVLPKCIGDEPPQLAKVRKRIEKIATGKVGFLDRRDKGVVGAVAHSLPLADEPAFPRMADAKVAGRRRFFLQRGHVIRSCMLGVQNHDEPRALVMAYRHMAKEHDLHFFAGPELWCTGQIPTPPRPWLQALTDKVGSDPVEDGDVIRYGSADKPRMQIQFRGGPAIEIDTQSSRKIGNLHAHMGAGYAGPRQRQPFEVHAIMPDGSRIEPEREDLASYRAGVLTDAMVLENTLRAWRGRTRADASEPRFVLADQDFGDDQEAFLSALNAEPWEVEALRIMTNKGSVGRGRSITDVLDAHEARLLDGIEAILEQGAKEFLQAHRGQRPRAVLRLAHDEQEARARTSVIPGIDAGPVGTVVDDVCRRGLRDGKPGSLEALRRALHGKQVAAGHIAAFLGAVGGDPSLEGRLSEEDKAMGATLQAAAAQVVAARGDAYPEAVQAYLDAAGTGESLR